MNINTAKVIIVASARANDTVIMEGPHGIGKSAAPKQFAVENNYHMEPLFLSHQEVGDIIGIPETIQQHGESITKWSKAPWLQRMDDVAWPKAFKYGTLSFNNDDFKEFVEKSLDYPTEDQRITRDELNKLYCTFFVKDEILHLTRGQMDVVCSDSKHTCLFLDELNRAPIDVRQSALELVLEKKIHEHKLPVVQGREAMIVAAINPADDYQVDELDPALLDRFLHIEVEADIEAFLDYGREVQMNSMVLDFLKEYPDRLFWQPKDGGIGATPRSWEKLAGFIDIIDEIPKEVHFNIFAGKLGSEIAGQLIVFMKDYTNVIKIEDIVELVEQEKENTSNIEELGDKVQELCGNMEAIQKRDMAKTIVAKFIDGDASETLPMMAFLYSLELEISAAFIKSYQETNPSEYSKIVKIDKELNNKNLFKRIIKELQRL